MSKEQKPKGLKPTPVVVSGTHEELFGSLRQKIETADSTTQNWQTEIAPGDHVLVCPEEGFFAYAKVLDPISDDEPAEEKAYLQETYAQPHMKNYRFAESFSPLCPEGELGDVHMNLVVAKLSEEQFEKAKAAGWPQTAEKIYASIGARVDPNRDAS